jgi:hypothetical protein
VSRDTKVCGSATEGYTFYLPMFYLHDRRVMDGWRKGSGTTPLASLPPPPILSLSLSLSVGRDRRFVFPCSSPGPPVGGGTVTVWRDTKLRGRATEGYAFHLHNGR